MKTKKREEEDVTGLHVEDIYLLLYYSLTMQMIMMKRMLMMKMRRKASKRDYSPAHN